MDEKEKAQKELEKPAACFEGMVKVLHSLLKQDIVYMKYEELKTGGPSAPVKETMSPIVQCVTALVKDDGRGVSEVSSQDFLSVVAEPAKFIDALRNVRPSTIMEKVEAHGWKLGGVLLEIKEIVQELDLEKVKRMSRPGEVLAAFLHKLVACAEAFAELSSETKALLKSR
uniref:Uncharacterized protein n=1 Tax=Chromera velia CCMP2878 TaxID=1169474 RepID=A0A0G4FP31_9ALVE|eukprot:Cvel_3569.t1-p1 / transcript=Cvel_3569.t1 / gene=Cvel_3569 / organism=Chromera_velia_CCMP2878 / gene_product=hypothetical protein / transcript_product=hypothetical protein / location=Cvel_scaffold146:34772-35281(-) / protein_length=170 / sequence_SO=supercontig / SO=protein_coding / is_pseudo=false